MGVNYPMKAREQNAFVAVETRIEGAFAAAV